jgi:hypothetical protein
MGDSVVLGCDAVRMVPVATGERPAAGSTHGWTPVRAVEG